MTLPEDVAERVRSAVDPLQTAAILESGGITDEVARARYAQPNVFTFGQQLFASSNRSPTRSLAQSQSARPLLADIGRGAIYAIPSLFFLASRRVVRHRHDVVVLVVATVLSWAAAQASSSIANGYLGRHDKSGAKTFLRRYLVGSIGIAILGGLAMWQLSDIGAVFSAVATLEVIYVAAATALLMFDRDVLHAVTLAPGLLVTILWLAGNPWRWSDRTTLALIGCGLLVTVSAALWSTRSSGAEPAQVRRLTAPEYVTASFLALHGAVWALLLASLSIAFLVSTRVGFRSDVPEGVILPVVLSMGLAERSLRHFRDDAAALLFAQTNRQSWQHAVVRALHRALSRYLTGLALVSTVTAGILQWQHRLSAESGVLLLAFAILGGGFFLGLLAVALGQVRLVVAWSVVAGLAIGALFLFTPNVSPITTLWLLTLGHVILFVGLYGIARAVVVRVAVHR